MARSFSIVSQVSFPMQEGFQKREQDHLCQISRKLQNLHVLEASQPHHLREELLRVHHHLIQVASKARLHAPAASLSHHLGELLLRVNQHNPDII